MKGTLSAAFRHLSIAALLSAAILAPASPVFADNKGKILVPHRAVYDLSLGAEKGANNISAARGRLVFDFAGSVCDGYTLNIRLVTQVTHRSGNALTTDLRSSTWEQGDGRKFRFNASEYQNQRLNEAANGTAIRNAGKPGVTINISRPVKEKLNYEGKILFPTQHTLEILKAALAGENIVQALVFDGSDQGKKLYKTTTFIGKKRHGGQQGGNEGQNAPDTVKSIRRLDKLDSWPVTISYFDGKIEGAETPAYELSFLLYRNGVSRKIIIDYGDFAIRGKLSSLEFFQPATCK